jgi:hypothetical protein
VSLNCTNAILLFDDADARVAFLNISFTLGHSLYPRAIAPAPITHGNAALAASVAANFNSSTAPLAAFSPALRAKASI